jgi:hypothetical protein
MAFFVCEISKFAFSVNEDILPIVFLTDQENAGSKNITETFLKNACFKK